MPLTINTAKAVLVRVGLPTIIAGMAAVAGWRFAVSPMVTPLWSPVLQGQVALYALFWFGLCAVTWLVARILSMGFRAALVAVALPLLAIVAGFQSVSVVGALFFDAFLIGARLRRPAPNEIQAPLLVAIGLAAMALLAGAAELLPFNSRGSFTAATAIIGLLLLDRAVRACIKAWVLQNLAKLRRGAAPPRSYLEDLALAVMIGILGLHLLFVLQPERYWDALVMHLYVPSYVLGHGRWAFDVDDLAFAHMPMTVDFLYTWAFALGGEDAVRLYNFGALVLIAGLIVSWIRSTTANVSAMVGALMFISTPLAFIETASLFIENSLTMWITAAAMEATMLWRRMEPTAARAILVLLAASVASKLHGVLVLGLVGLVMLVPLLRMRLRPGPWIAFSVVVGTLAFVPYLYAWIDTGNPVFPLFNKLFRSSSWPPTDLVDTRWTGHLDWALLWKATFHSSRFIEGYDGVLGLSLVIFLPLACVVALFSRQIFDRLALFIGVGLVLLVAIQIQYLRYLYIALPILFF